MKQSTFLKVLALSIGVLCILLGVLVLIGWHSQITALIQVLPFLVPMQYNTALGFLLFGTGFLAVNQNRYLLGKFMLSMVGIVGLLTLFEYISGIDIGIDQLLMEHYITVETSHPGRMAPNTALCFLLTSIAMHFSLGEHYKKIQVGGMLGFFVFGLGLVSFVGYLIGMEATYGWGKLTKMAVHTALGFMTIGIGIVVFCFKRELESSNRNMQNNNFLFWGISISVALIIFFIDLSLPLGIAAGVLYILIVLFAWFIKIKYAGHILATLSSFFVIIGYFYSIGGVENWMVITNRGFSIMVIWVVAGLLHNIKVKEEILVATNNELDHNLIDIKNKNKELAQFTYIASHDLQEPLRTVTNFTNLLVQEYKGQLDENADTYLNFISQASTRMSNLIKGLLDYSRIGNNKQKTVVDIDGVISDLQVDLHSTIHETGTRITVESMPKIWGYKLEMSLLFQNLISNAIKFRRKEENPKIKITAKDIDGFFEFRVRDNGIGIDSDHQKKIFAIFKRLHSQKEYEGTGIGLAHCQKIVALHQGTIKVSSTPNCGSEFIFTIKKPKRYEAKIKNHFTG